MFINIFDLFLDGGKSEKNRAMIQIAEYNLNNIPTLKEEQKITQFLFDELEQYGDPKRDIQKAIDYALGRNGKPGGMVLVAKEDEQIVSAVVINDTGMSDYIPENILVYIATDKNQRGKGIGKMIIQEVIARTKGDIALHVDPNNPAKKLYERLGFTNKYLEMRLNKKA